MDDAAATTRSSGFFQQLDRWGVHCILALSLGLNVYLGLKVRSAPPALQSTPTIAVGAQAPTLYAEDLDGKKVVVDWSAASQSTILYIFSPSCIWCQRNTDNFDAIVRERQHDYRIVGLSTTGSRLRDYVESHHIGYPVYANPDASKCPIYGQASTPATYLISPAGTVQAMWRGAYAGDTKKRIEAMLHVQLPGIKAD